MTKYPNSARRLLAILEELKPNQPVISQLAPLFFSNSPNIQDIKQKSLLGIKAIAQLPALMGNTKYSKAII